VILNITTKLVKKPQYKKKLLVLEAFPGNTMLQILAKANDVQSVVTTLRRENKKIGFVPTMGALHSGHISLIKSSLLENDFTVCSIFVNPTQFNDKADYGRYPRSIEQDSKMLEAAGCNLIFLPSEEEIYPDESFKTIDFDTGALSDSMEGKYRPGHFKGVATVVKRLFDIVQPDNAYFGQKDYQQYLIIQKLVKDFNIQVKITLCPTLREADGLAMSSRNMLLTEEERLQAPFIYHMLQLAKDMWLQKNAKQDLIINTILSEFKLNGNFQPDYFDICSAESLQPISDLSNKDIVICVAAFLGKVRLIDNLLIKGSNEWKG
jgi:pantoate--beta-alanine ligase